MSAPTVRRYGAQGMTGRLRRVLLNTPGPRYGAAHDDPAAHYAEPIELERARSEHDAFVRLLRVRGVEVELLGEEAGPDSIYVYDPALVCDGGAILLRSGKEVRRGEPDAQRRFFEREGIPVLAELTGPALADGGDLLWLDERTLVVGRGFRTNQEGASQLTAALAPFVDAVEVVDVPYDLGPDICLHTLSFISMLDRDLALVSLSRMPVHLYELLRERGVGLVEIDESEWPTLAPNALAIGPREVVLFDRNQSTIERLRAAGCTVHAIAGDEMGVKGSGGPTCLTLPLLRTQ